MHVEQMRCLLVVRDFESAYLYRKWRELLKELSFEPLMSHEPGAQEDYVLYGWHIIELFCVLKRQRVHPYHLAWTWWTQTAECTGIYPMPSLSKRSWLYIYYAW